MTDAGWEVVYEDGGGGGAAALGDLGPLTVFGDALIELSVVFRMRRPRNHYINNRAGGEGQGRLKTGWRDCDDRVTGGKTDVDNLLKFFMDSLNGICYDDDRQIVSVKATKVYDAAGEGEGGIDFVMRRIEGGELWNAAEELFNC